MAPRCSFYHTLVEALPAGRQRAARILQPGRSSPRLPIPRKKRRAQIEAQVEAQLKRWLRPGLKSARLQIRGKRCAPSGPAASPRPRLVRGWRLSLARLRPLLIAIAALASYWWLALPAPRHEDQRPAPGPSQSIARRSPCREPADHHRGAASADNLSGDAGLQSFSDGISEEISGFSREKCRDFGLSRPARPSKLRRDTATRGLGMTPQARYHGRGARFGWRKTTCRSAHNC